MRLSQAVAPARPLPVEFDGGEVLNITYRPASYTVLELDELQADSRNTRRIVESMLRTLISWDMEYDPEVNKDDEGAGLSGLIPLETGPLERYVPTSVFVVIMQAMQKDQQPGGDAPSDAG